MSRRIVIGVVGLAGSGKTLVARHLIERHGFVRQRFAGPLKDMLKAGLGLTDEQLDGDQKMQPLAWAGGSTPRHIMQTLGTEWGRRLIHPDLWVNRWREVAMATPESCIVCDDVRFPNEAEVIRDVGGFVWRIVRPGLATMDHASERMQRSITEDTLINNATSIPDMIRSVELTLASVKGATHD